MDPAADPRFVELFDRAWPPAFALAEAVVGAERAERVTVEALAQTFERWHRVARGNDPAVVALRRTAQAAVRHAKRQGASVAQRAEEMTHTSRGTTGSAPDRATVDAGVRAAIVAMPRRVATAFALHHLCDPDDPTVAAAVRRAPRRMRRRAARGMAILRREAGPGARERVHA